MNNLTQNWWMIVLRGLLAIAFGVAAFVWPGITWLTLVFLFGIYAIVDGLIAVATGLRQSAVADGDARRDVSGYPTDRRRAASSPCCQASNRHLGNGQRRQHGQARRAGIHPQHA